MHRSVPLPLQGGYAAYRYAQPAAAAAAYSDRYQLGAVSQAGQGQGEDRMVPTGLGSDRQSCPLLRAWGCLALVHTEASRPEWAWRPHASKLPNSVIMSCLGEGRPRSPQFSSSRQLLYVSILEADCPPSSREPERGRQSGAFCSALCASGAQRARA